MQSCRHVFYTAVFPSFLIVLCVSTALRAHTPAVPPPTTTSSVEAAKIDAYVKRVLESFDVPGMGIAIVKDGKVVLEKGYGVRNLATGAPANAHTLFAIASNTKAFTGASLEILANRGKLDMDARVIKYLPWFRMSNTYVTHEMRVHDLLAHDSGLPDGQTTDILFTPDSDYSGRQVAERLAHVPLEYSFRSRTAYDNILYGVAALVVEEASGKSYRQFLKDNILGPLGMHDTRFNYHYIRESDHNVSTGYVPFGPEGKLKAAHKMAWGNSSGAAGIYSSVHDMAKWVMMQIAGGVYSDTQGSDSKRLFSEDSHKRMWTMQSIIQPDKDQLRIESQVPALASIAPDYEGFGEGWHLSQYRRYKMAYHTGGWPGFVSRVTIIPDLNLGIVVLTNQRSGGAFNSVTNHILDAYMGVPQTDWIKAYTKAKHLREQRRDKKWKEFVAARVKDSGPSLDLADYAGSYDSWYGKVDIRRQGRDGLVIRFAHTKRLVGRLTHWSHDTFAIHWSDRLLRADAYITFGLTPKGEVKGARLSSSPEYRFSYMFNKLVLTPVGDDVDDGASE